MLDHLAQQEQLRGRREEVARRLAALEEERRRLGAEADALEARGRRGDEERRRAELSLGEIRRRAERLARELEEVRRLPSPKKTLAYRTPAKVYFAPEARVMAAPATPTCSSSM